MSKSSNEITLKFAYTCIKQENSNKILEYIKNYNCVLRYVYNRLYDIPNHSMSTKDIFDYIRNMKNIFIDTYFENGAIYEAKALIKNTKDKKVIFGGKKLFIKRCQNKISKEEFKLKRLHPLQVVDASYNHGNCKFQIIDETTVIFKPTKDEHFNLNLLSTGKNYNEYLKLLIQAQKDNKLPITYKLDMNYIYITFDINTLKPPTKHSYISDRIFAIDMNPNYIGWSVNDWHNADNFKVIKSGVISLKPLNDYENSLSLASNDPEMIHITNKRHYETIQIAHTLVKLAKHYKCEIFAVEDLTMFTKDNGYGTSYNKLLNKQWNRNLLFSILYKDCSQNSMYFHTVTPDYSSVVGNLAYRYLQLPDMVLASIEISRRAYEYYHQYILEDKPKVKNIIFNNSKKVLNSIEKSAEELGFTGTFKNIKDLYNKLKKMSCNIRFPLESALKVHSQSLFSKNYIKKYTIFYEFT